MTSDIMSGMVSDMARHSTLHLHDKILDGQLVELLTKRRSDGASFEAISRQLATEHDLTVSSATVARWCAELQIIKAAS